MIIKQKVYWGLDENEKVLIDEEEIERDFRRKLQAIILQYTGSSEKEMEDK